MAVGAVTQKKSKLEPAWEIAHLFPLQGAWSEADYLALETNHLVEFSDGNIEVLPMPSERHQDIVIFLLGLLKAFIAKESIGKVLIAPFRIRLRKDKYREPDVMFMLREHSDKRTENYWHGADLVMEVVSPDDPKRDTEVKLREYAQAGIPEYWLVNPLTEKIMVFVLAEEAEGYHIHGEFAAGETAGSRLLDGFTVDVAAVFTEDAEDA